jgi:hypothetical protein
MDYLKPTLGEKNWFNLSQIYNYMNKIEKYFTVE